MTRPKICHIVLLTTFLGVLLLSFNCIAQSPGLIFEPATGSVLDKNVDGFITNTGGAFSSGGDDVAEFEGDGWTRFPKLRAGEVLVDQRSGPGEGFSDFSMDQHGYATYMRIDEDVENIIFRFRIADFLPNAKGYTVLIDTDGTIGVDDTDSYIAGVNPGFELAVLLKSKHGVYIIDFDASSNDGSCDQVEYTHPLSTNHQKAFGGARVSGSLDAFYDFYVPLADLFAAGGIDETTGLRFVATANTSNTCTFLGSLADIGGLDDTQYPCAFCAMEELVNRQLPTSVEQIIAEGLPTSCPEISGEIQAGTDVILEGYATTSSEVRLYINGLLEQTTTSDAVTGFYQFTIPNLAEGDMVYTTSEDVGAGLIESAGFCNEAVVISACTGGPPLVVRDPPGMSSKLADTTAVGLGPVENLDMEIRLYGTEVLETGALISYDNLTGAWQYELSPADGSDKFEGMEYEARMKDAQGCWSDWVVFCGQSNAPKGVAPIVTSPSGSIVGGNQIDFSGTVDIINRTGADGAIIYIEQNDAVIGSVMVSGTRNQSGVPWAINGVDIGLMGDIEVSSIPLINGSIEGCRTSQLNKVVIELVRVQSTAPTITGTYCGESDVITGTTTEPEGSTIRIYRQDSELLGRTAVDASGNWSWKVNSSQSGTLDGIYATAQNEAEMEEESQPSSGLLVGNPELRPGLGITDAPVTESSSTLEVTGLINGDQVNVFADGTRILSAVAASDVHSFNLPADYIDLESITYANAQLTATTGAAGQCQSLPSAPVTVVCDLPDDLLVVSAPVTQGCGSIDNAVVSIAGTQQGVIYTPFNTQDLTVPLGLSKLGDGADHDLQIGSFSNPGVETVVIEARKGAQASCVTYLQSTVEFTVLPNPDISDFAVGSTADICQGSMVSVSFNSSSIADGSYIITYDISDPNYAVGLSETILIVGGAGTIETSAMENAGNTTVTLTSISDADNGCSSTITENNVVAVMVDPCNVPPTLIISDASVEEGIQVVLTAGVEDPDVGDSWTFSMDGPDAGRFELDAQTGALSFLVAPDFEDPQDVGSNNVYDLNVTVTDNHGAQDTESIRVTVLPVNDNEPVLTAVDVEVLENKFEVQTVSAVDADDGDVLSFSISGPDNAFFHIDAATGVLEFISAPDFEDPEDDDGDNVYLLDVTVRDAANQSDTKSIKVTVLPANDNDPVLTAVDVEVPENVLEVQTVSAVDADGGDVLSFSISGLDHEFFEINSETGELKFIEAPDFENPQDAGLDNIYQLAVIVQDEAGHTDVETINIIVSALNDSPPIVQAENVSMPENITNVQTVDAIDADYGDSKIFSLDGPDKQLFRIHAITGVLNFIEAPDFENPQDAGMDNTYDIVVIVNDAFDNTGSKDIQITVTDVNDNSPVLSVEQEYQVPEGTVEVTVISASDADFIEKLSFSISGIDAGLFTIDSKSGALQFKTAPSYANPQDADGNHTYELTVIVEDMVGHSDAAAIAVTVVVSGNVEPLAIDDNIEVQEGSAATGVNLLSNDVDPDGDPLTIKTTAVVDVKHGKLIIYSDGTFRYVPFLGYHGNDEFTYEVCDNRGACVTAAVMIVVSQVDDDLDDDGILNEVEGLIDTDGDGIPNLEDTDSDNDGIPDIIEGTDDVDGDFIPNYIDDDSDGDGLLDRDEIEANSLTDCDSDGIPDYLDFDRCEVAITRGFSPNGDGENDAWYLEGIDDYPLNRVKIFNRWGNLVFEIEGYNNRDRVWTGNSSGAFVVGNNEVPDGTYFFMVELGDGSRPVSGFVVVKR